jgi:hypothetical protein
MAPKAFGAGTSGDEASPLQVGVALLVLGGMHFFNLLVFSKMRIRALLHRAPPRLQPQTQIPVAAG